MSFSVLANESEQASAYAAKLKERLMTSKKLLDVHSSEKVGRPEVTVKVDPNSAGRFGVNEGLVGQEIRGRIEGSLSGRYRDRGREYDIRVKMQDGSDTFLSQINQVLVPNLNMTPVRLKDVAQVSEGISVAKLERRNRSAAVTDI